VATKGEVEIQIKADDKASGKMKTIGKSATDMSATFKKAGLAITALGVGMAIALGKMVTSYAEAGDEVAKMAHRTGLGTEALSELHHVANITGTDLSSIEKAVRTMTGAITDANEGMTTYIRAFERIGLSIEDLIGLSPEEQFWKIARAIGDLEDETLKVATAADIFGRAGTQLLPMMDETGESIDALRQEAHDLNLVFSEESAAAAESFQDSKTRLVGAFQGMFFSLAEQLMPTLEGFINLIKNIITKITDWMEAHPALADAIGKVGLALTALCLTGGPMLLFIAYIPQIIAGIVALKAALMAQLIPALVKATLAFIAMLATMGPWGWAALAGGVIAAGAAIAGLAKLGLLGGGGGAAEYGKGMVRWNDEWITQEEANRRRAEREANLNFQRGGIVPGPIGRPVPIIAHGGEVFAGAGGGFGPTVNVYVAGSVVTEADLAERLREVFIGIKSRNVTTGF
jgi:hypothetical protein